jgi:dihydroneopterin aldolase
VSRIDLRGIECRAHIGVGRAERARRQRVVLDVRLEGGRFGNGSARRRELALEVQRLIESGRFVLIEATLLKVARWLFRRTAAGRVRVRMRKFVLPATDHVEVEMEFRREEAGP